MNGNAPLYPVNPLKTTHEGITIREHFTCEMAKAMITSGAFSHQASKERAEAIALAAVQMADALLRTLP